jgi:hypothetical protein
MMKFSSRLALIGGAAVLSLGIAGSASALPVAPKAAVADVSATTGIDQVRNGARGPGWRGGGRGWAPRYAYRGGAWRGGRGYWRGGRWYGYGPGWGWGGAAFAGAAIAGAAIAAPYYYGGGPYYGNGYGQCQAQVIGPNGARYMRWVPC